MRRGYLDWLRGLAVLIMISSHILDSWTRFPDRELPLYRWSLTVAGFGAPLFLFLAGVSVALSAGSKTRRTGDARAAARVVTWRGFQIFVLAFLFRLQALFVSWGPWRSLLKVDILNLMGPSIMAAAALWGALRTTRGRLLAFAFATLAVALLTPAVRVTTLLDVLPDPIEAYLRPRAGYTAFAVFPWGAFVFAGALVGVLLDEARTASVERRLNFYLALAGGALALGAFGASYLPTPFEGSHFWTSSPSYFLLRTGLLALTVGAAYLWYRRPRGGTAFSPLEQMGRTSLFIYWIHIELIYGLMVRPLHKALTLGQAGFGILIFALLMLILSLIKERVAASFRRAPGLAAT
ncbi:hypothetical protein BH24ACI5_BH24ACI5_14780 [soil metagenome]